MRSMKRASTNTACSSVSGVISGASARSSVSPNDGEGFTVKRSSPMLNVIGSRRAVVR